MQILVSTLPPYPTGYSALHHGAAWGRLGCLHVLASSGADHRLLTRHKENPRDIAERYGKTACVEYLDCVGTQDSPLPYLSPVEH